MSTPTAATTPDRFTLGMSVTDSDGACGELRRVILDPATGTVTYLVVGAKHHRTGGHLVPIELVDSTAGTVVLHCSSSDLNLLADAEAAEFFPATMSPWAGMGSMGGDNRLEVVIRDSFPYGEVEIARGDRVLASDGPIGRVRGVLTDQASDRITFVLLDEGHPWGRREVAIPIAALDSIDNGLRLNLTKADVRDLPTSSEA